MSEKTLHRAVCDYLRMAYPNVLFNSDLAGATKLTIGQAVALKSLRSSRGVPDLFIMEPRSGYHGMFIELKAEGTKLFKKNGEPVSDHIAEQIEFIDKLMKRGYLAVFGIGFEKTKILIDRYLKSVL